MPTTSTRLLERTTLSDGDTMSADAAADCGDGASLDLVIDVEEACEGESPALLLRHAPDAADAAWLDFPTPVRVALDRPGRTWVHAPCYTRYVGWSLAGTLYSSPVVSVTLLAKG